MDKAFFKKTIYLIFTCLILFLCFSCSKKAEHKSISNRLEDIDSLIAQGDYESAESELESLEDNSYTHWDFLSVYKRYKIIGNLDRCESVLLKGIEKNEENLELTAVLCNLYLNDNKISKALEHGKILQGTKYGSIYSEAVFKDTLNKNKSGDLEKVFKNDDFYSVYYDSYVGTENQNWLIDCALIRLANGSYENAASIRPEEVYSAKDGLFWALALYDAKRFGDSVNYAEAARKLLSDNHLVSKKDRINEALLSSIEADCWTALMDQESAEKVRRIYINQMKDSKGKLLVPSDESENEGILPYIFVNSAKWAFENNNNDECRTLITYACDYWPDFIPALSFYGDFAWKTSSVRKESESQMALRDAGVTSVEQQRYDNRVKVPVEDAIFRVDESLKRTNNPLTYILSLDLHYKYDKKRTPKEKIADLWLILEKNEIKKHVYPNLLLDYMTIELLKNNQNDVALDLYTNFISAKYEKPDDERFWNFVTENKEKFSSDEVNILSYFAAYELKEKESLDLYEFSVYEKAEDEENFISPSASDVCCINLAMLYSSAGRKQDAIDLYNKISGKTSDLKTKSMVVYRMGKIFYDDGDIKNARKCADYAIDLDKHNAEASLLKNKIRY